VRNYIAQDDVICKVRVIKLCLEGPLNAVLYAVCPRLYNPVEQEWQSGVLRCVCLYVISLRQLFLVDTWQVILLYDLTALVEFYNVSETVEAIESFSVINEVEVEWTPP
jgi:hypothetical protein